MKILDGLKIQNEMIEELREYFSDKRVEIAIIQLGNLPESNAYVRQKKIIGEKIGVGVSVIKLDEDITNDELKLFIRTLNKSEKYQGIMVQEPLPAHIDTSVLDIISPTKDIDCQTTVSKGYLFNSKSYNSFEPCTPKGIILTLDKYNIDIAGKDVLVIGRSDIVGRPMAEMFTQRNATVTLAHSQTANIKEKLSNYDIIVVAVGKKEFITNEDIATMKDGVILIDVGIHRDEVDGKAVFSGDIVKNITEDNKEKISYITPVPGGVGRTTVVGLFLNLKFAIESPISNDFGYTCKYR